MFNRSFPTDIRSFAHGLETGKKLRGMPGILDLIAGPRAGKRTNNGMQVLCRDNLPSGCRSLSCLTIS